MKTAICNLFSFFLPLFLCAFLFSEVSAQELKDTIYVGEKVDISKIKKEDNAIYLNADKNPQITGKKGIYQHIRENIRSISELDLNQDSLRGNVVVVKLVISDNGNAENISVVRRAEPSLDAEVINAVKQLPKFKPGKKGKKNIPVQALLSFPFYDITKPQTANLLNDGAWLPAFPGGREVLNLFLKSNLKYPEMAYKRKIQGRVILRFVVSDTGEIDEVKVVKSLSLECDQEAKRVVRSMPLWEPGTENGKPVPVYFTLPILFRFQ